MSQNTGVRSHEPGVIRGSSALVWRCGIALALALLAVACSDAKSKQEKPKPVPVLIASAERKDVPVQLTAIGTVEAYSTVSVRSLVGGTLSKIHFREGQDVGKGSILFTIDPRPFEAALRQAEATMARDAAQMENARLEAKRYEELVKKGYVSRSQYEQMKTNADALEAVVRADSAAVENARLQLGYCSIHAPISGRGGSLLVNQGNIVKANDDKALVVINRIQPIYVNFSVPERYLSDIRKYMSTGRLNVLAYINKEDEKPENGILTFVDNTVDISTGTIKFKATFTNKEKRLWPGQFVNVIMTLTIRHDSTLIPSHAVQTGQTGQYVFVVKGDTAELRPVTAGITHGDMTVIEKGIEPGEVVVTDGQMRLVPGAKVEVKKAQEQKNNSRKESSQNENPAKDKAK